MSTLRRKPSEVRMFATELDSFLTPSDVQYNQLSRSELERRDLQNALPPPPPPPPLPTPPPIKNENTDSLPPPLPPPPPLDEKRDNDDKEDDDAAINQLRKKNANLEMEISEILASMETLQNVRTKIIESIKHGNHVHVEEHIANLVKQRDALKSENAVLRQKYLSFPSLEDLQVVCASKDVEWRALHKCVKGMQHTVRVNTERLRQNEEHNKAAATSVTDTAPLKCVHQKYETQLATFKHSVMTGKERIQDLEAKLAQLEPEREILERHTDLVGRLAELTSNIETTKKTLHTMQRIWRKWKQRGVMSKGVVSVELQQQVREVKSKVDLMDKRIQHNVVLKEFLMFPKPPPPPPEFLLPAVVTASAVVRRFVRGRDVRRNSNMISQSK